MNFSAGVAAGLNAGFKNRRAMNKTLVKLSTGLRINSASDDAAGLAISEGLRAQVRGSAQARKNALDGISMLNIAEGAMGEVAGILQRGRELSVQSSSETLTDNERQYLQQELGQLTEEVDRISDVTSFNGINLLNAGGVDSTTSTELTDRLQSGWLEAAEDLVFAGLGLTGDGVDMSVMFERNGAGGTAAYVQYSIDGSGLGTNLELHIDADDIDAGPDNNGGTGPVYSDRIIAHEMVHAVMARTIPDANTPLWFKEGMAEFIHGGDERLKSSMLSGSSVTDLINGISGESWTGSSDDYAAGYLMVRYLDRLAQDSGSSIKTIMSDLANGDSFDDVINNNTSTFTETTNGVNIFTEAIDHIGPVGVDITDPLLNAETRIVLDSGTDESDTGSAVGADAGYGGAEDAEGIMEYSGTTNDQPISGFNLVWDDSEPITLQIGANSSEDDRLELEYGTVNSKSLGIDSVNIGSASAAQGAISQFDSAIRTLSSSRSDIGSYVNRLEHTVNNLITSENNQQAAESQIRDVDFAAETAKFAKQQILAQVSNSMLAQANQQRNSILSLIQ